MRWSVNQQVKSQNFIVIFVLASGIIFWAGVEKSAFAEKNQFRKIFDGKTYNNWVIEGAEECWFINRRRLCCIANEKGKWIRTEKKFKHFILKIEWKISEGGEAGLLIGFNPDLTTKKSIIRIPFLNQLEDNLHCTGSIAGIAPVNRQPDSSPGVWHTMKIHCSKTEIIVFCDGEKRTQYNFKQNNSKFKYPLEGHIAFQAVADHPFNEIEFRDIQIKKLDD